jgi:hypothetical protein
MDHEPLILRPNLIYGETVITTETDRFFVEAVWPDTHSVRAPRLGRKEFKRYSRFAFNDRRRPNTQRDGYGKARGTFEEENPDVAKHPSRLELRAPLDNIAVFSDPAAALAYAVRLAEVGELASKYDNMTHIEGWRERHSAAIQTRVVHERSALIAKVVEGLRHA